MWKGKAKERENLREIENTLFSIFRIQWGLAKKEWVGKYEALHEFLRNEWYKIRCAYKDRWNKTIFSIRENLCLINKSFW